MAQNGFQLLDFGGHYNHSSSLDATIMVSENFQIIVEHVVISFDNMSKNIKWPYKRFYFIEFQKALKFFALELGGIEFTSDVTKTGNGEWGMGNGKWEIENGKWEIENGKLIFFTLTFYNVE